MSNSTARWREFLEKLPLYKEITLVGPFAAPRAHWPEPAIFIDSASRHKGESSLHVSVGDGDSSLEALDHTLPVEKDFSDLAYVLKEIPENIQRLSMVGFLGGRRDHEFMNLGEIHRFLSKRTKPTECDVDWSVCGFSAGRWPLDFRGIFSTVALQNITLTITGKCRYQISTPAELSALSSHGLSNEAFGLIEIESNGPLFIFKNPFS